MRAVTIVDRDLRFAEHPDPEPGDTELLVSVRGAGINNADLMQRLGFYPAPPGVPPDIPGMELAGEVVATGRRTTRFSIGDRVMALVGGGAQAELAVVDERCAVAVPGDVTWPEAGAFPEAFSTAYDALFTQCQLAVGERVLVTGAAGGVGTAGVQLAAAAGARCVASVRHAHLRDAVAALGATAAGPDEALGLGPFDVVLELAVVDERCAVAVPGDVTWPEAGGFPEAFSTAYDALFTQCQLAMGERVLITGAAGGVGTAGVQLAAAAGARCVASVRHAHRREAVAALGATAAGPDEALALGPFDVVLELVGAASLSGVLGAMTLSGRIAVIGVGGGAQAEVDLLAVMQRRLRISGSTLRSRSLVDKAVVASQVEHHVVPLLEAGKVRVPLEAIFPMDRAGEAYERFGQGGKVGKIVLVPDR